MYSETSLFLSLYKFMCKELYITGTGLYKLLLFHARKNIDLLELSYVSYALLGSQKFLIMYVCYGRCSRNYLIRFNATNYVQQKYILICTNKHIFSSTKQNSWGYFSKLKEWLHCYKIWNTRGRWAKLSKI